MKKEPNIKIFVTHFNKPGYIYEDDVFVPIQAGKKNSKIDLGIQGDDTGDNISEKNSSYAELTVQYWVWKNYDLSNVDYVGFCHYRRYMTYAYKPNVLGYFFKKNPYSERERRGLLPWYYKAFIEGYYCEGFDSDILKNISKDIKEHLKKNKYDLYQSKREISIMAKLSSHRIIPHIWYEPVNLDYDNLNIWKMSMDLFFKVHPECIKSIVTIQNEGREGFILAHSRHIYLMKKSLFLEYSKWLFEYLFLLEELINKNKYDFYHYFNEKRFYGIIAEPLINYRRSFMIDNFSMKTSFDANLYFCV